MILEICTFTLVLLTLGGFINHPWWLTLLDFFRLQYALAACAVFAVTLFFGRYDLSLVCAGVAAVNFFRIRHFFPSFEPLNVYQNKDVLSINAWKENRDLKELLEIINGADPQLLLIMEMTDRLETHLHEALARYPYRLETPMRDGFRICLLSKNVLKDTKITYHGDGKTALLHAKCKIYDKVYQIFSAHPKPALNRQWHKERLTYFKEIEPILASPKLPVLMMGDFNSVPWESHFMEFTTISKLRSTIEGYGYHMTWPTFFPIAGVPMDHILVSQDVKYYDLHIGPHIGSDHYPIAINLKQRAKI